MDIYGAMELIMEEGLTAHEALQVVMAERRVRSADWEPKKDSAGYKAVALLATNPGLNLKQVAAEMGLKRSGAYHALVGSQDAGLVANLGGNKGYMITDKGAAYARKMGIKVTGRVAPEMLGQATDRAQARKLPQDIELGGAMYAALGNVASDSSLGKRTTNVRPGELGTSFKKVGNRANWTVTLAGNKVGARYKNQTVFLRKDKGVMKTLENAQQVTSTATSHIQKALNDMGIPGGPGTMEVVGWQADVSMTSGSDDIVVFFDSALPPEPEKTSAAELKRDKMRKPSQMMKRAQKLIQRASKGPRMGTMSRAMKIMQRLQTQGK